MKKESEAHEKAVHGRICGSFFAVAEEMLQRIMHTVYQHFSDDDS
jgi:hypothetical protein